MKVPHVLPRIGVPCRQGSNGWTAAPSSPRRATEMSHPSSVEHTDRRFDANQRRRRKPGVEALQ